MRTETEQDFPTGVELQARIVAFCEGSHTLERASDCGFLAVMTPTRFGGLGVNHKYWDAVRRKIGTVDEKLSWRIHSHLQVCNMINITGTPAQHDLFLPQLAAGKRIGVNATSAKELYTAIEGNVCYITGWSVSHLPISDNTILLMDGWSGTQRYYITVSSTLLSSVRRSGRGHYVWSITGGIVPLEAVLFLPRQDQVLSNEEWEAIRWRTDQSVS